MALEKSKHVRENLSGEEREAAFKMKKKKRDFSHLADFMKGIRHFFAELWKKKFGLVERALE